MCFCLLIHIAYLSHRISGAGVEVDPDKIQAVQQWALPTTVQSLRGFMGLTGYYRRFIANYAKLAAPLTNLLRKNAFVWTNIATEAFRALKIALTTTPVLHLQTLPNRLRSKQTHHILHRHRRRPVTRQPSNRELQQGLKTATTSYLYLCLRNIRNYGSYSTIAIISSWSAFHHLYWPPKSPIITIPNSPNTWATQMVHQTTWVWVLDTL